MIGPLGRMGAAATLGQHCPQMTQRRGFSSEIGTKLRDWAVGQDGGSCYSRAALSSNDSKTLYLTFILMPRCIKKKTNTNIYIKGFLSEIGTKLHDRWAGRGQLLISGSIVLK